MISSHSRTTTDEFNRVTGRRKEGGNAARELPGIVDQYLDELLCRRAMDGAMNPNAAMPAAGLPCRQPSGFPPRTRGRLDSPSRRISARSYQNHATEG